MKIGVLASFCVFSLLVAACLGGIQRPQPPPPEDVALLPNPTFAKDIQPILQDSCVKCHNQFDAHAGLRLDSYEYLMQTGELGPIVAPGKPKESILLHVIKRQLEPYMPYHGEVLTPNRVANIERWIAQGAIYR